MKILKHGNPLYAVIKCHRCGCIFEAYQYEFKQVDIYARGQFFDIDCPDCHKEISTSKEHINWLRELQ